MGYYIMKNNIQKFFSVRTITLKLIVLNINHWSVIRRDNLYSKQACKYNIDSLFIEKKKCNLKKLMYLEKEKKMAIDHIYLIYFNK